MLPARIDLSEWHQKIVASDSTAKTDSSITEQLHELVLNSSDVEDFLTELTQVSARHLSAPGDEILCAITLRRLRKATLVASTSTEARSLALLELDFPQTPGTAATSLQAGAAGAETPLKGNAGAQPAGRVAVHAEDLAVDSRWPGYSEAVLGHGVRSVLALAFDLDGETKAALLLYSGRPQRFDERDVAFAKDFVKQTSLALSLAIRFAHHSETAANLRAAMESRTVIDMAVGIIMAQSRCSQADAFEILRTASSTRNAKVHDVAASVVNALGQGPAKTHYDG